LFDMSNIPCGKKNILPSVKSSTINLIPLFIGFGLD